MPIGLGLSIRTRCIAPLPTPALTFMTFAVAGMLIRSTASIGRPGNDGTGGRHRSTRHRHVVAAVVVGSDGGIVVAARTAASHHICGTIHCTGYWKDVSIVSGTVGAVVMMMMIVVRGERCVGGCGIIRIVVVIKGPHDGIIGTPRQEGI